MYQPNSNIFDKLGFFKKKMKNAIFFKFLHTVVPRSPNKKMDVKNVLNVNCTHNNLSTICPIFHFSFYKIPLFFLSFWNVYRVILNVDDQSWQTPKKTSPRSIIQWVACRRFELSFTNGCGFLSETIQRPNKKKKKERKKNGTNFAADFHRSGILTNRE